MQCNLKGFGMPVVAPQVVAEQLTRREQQYLLAAIRLAPTKADRYTHEAMMKATGLDREDCDDIARILSRNDAAPVVRRLDGGGFCLADVGREIAKQLAEDAKLRNRLKALAGKAVTSGAFWGAIWGGNMGLVSSLLVAYLVHRYGWNK